MNPEAGNKTIEYLPINEEKEDVALFFQKYWEGWDDLKERTPEFLNFLFVKKEVLCIRNSVGKIIAIRTFRENKLLELLVHPKYRKKHLGTMLTIRAIDAIRKELGTVTIDVTLTTNDSVEYAKRSLVNCDNLRFHFDTPQLENDFYKELPKDNY